MKEQDGSSLQQSHMANAMSVDVEDWFQVGAFENNISRSDWGDCVCRVERNTNRLLQIFDEKNIKATFFTLGWVAERYPRLIRQIVEAGHELASHGYDHKRVFRMTPHEFRDDLRRSRAILEEAGGCVISGYRAPSFSFDSRTPWAHEILSEEGYSYSSSVAPIHHDHYGWPQTPRFAWLAPKSRTLIELPMTTTMLWNKRFAMGGGGFFRALPYPLFQRAISHLNQAEGRSAIFYFHPWEIDPQQPVVEKASIKSKLRHYIGLGRMERKLNLLLDDFSWVTMRELADWERSQLSKKG